MLPGDPPFPDHKPLTTAINRSSDPWTARQCRQLAYVAEYTSDVRHIAGTSNVVADTLSCPPKAVTGVAACQGGKAEPGTVASVTAPPRHQGYTQDDQPPFCLVWLRCGRVTVV